MTDKRLMAACVQVVAKFTEETMRDTKESLPWPRLIEHIATQAKALYKGVV